MQMQAETPCIRCGKLRVFYRKWNYKADGKGFLITHVESVCPDSECQKVVDEKFAEMREKRLLLEDKRKNVLLSRRTKKNSYKNLF